MADIQILMGTKGHTEEVDATLYGQLAVHIPDYAVDTVSVTHIKSGCLVAKFYRWQDATDFAEKANLIMDFDTYAVSLTKFGVAKTKAIYRQPIDALRALKDEYESSIKLSDHADVPVKLIKKYMAE